MGLIHQFACATCNYTARVAGGRDRGMLATRMTIHCRGCRELADVIIAMRGPLPNTLEHRIAPRCPHCRSSRQLTPWTHPGACPRCGAALQAEAVVEFWD